MSFGRIKRKVEKRLFSIGYERYRDEIYFNEYFIIIFYTSKHTGSIRMYIIERPTLKKVKSFVFETKPLGKIYREFINLKKKYDNFSL